LKSLKEYEVVDYEDEEVRYFHYEDESGSYYESLEIFLQSHVLGFCVCGDPQANLKLIYDLIILKEKWSNKEIGYNEYDLIRNQYLSENIDSIGWFFDYFLDKHKITTHGGNVSGSWIDDENFLEAIKLWHEKTRWGAHC
jgi:hypothetical protein